MKLDTNNHSVFSMNYHVIFCIKYRRKVLDDKISLRLKEIFEKISPKYQIILTEWEHDRDHVHMLIRGTPKTELSKFINAYKSASSRLIKKDFFWSRSFLLLTVGGAPIETIKQYIQNQGNEEV